MVVSGNKKNDVNYKFKLKAIKLVETYGNSPEGNILNLN